MFMKDQFRLLKNSNSEQNVIELFQQQNQNLIPENVSKNTIIKILSDNSNSKSTVSDNFTTVTSILRQKKSPPRKHKKVDLNYSDRYETRYITDSNKESETEDSDDITITDTSTDKNRRPGYTHRMTI